MKYLLFLSLIFFATTAYAGTPLDSTSANIGIGKIFDTSGRIQRLIVTPGCEAQVRGDLGVLSNDNPTFTGTVTATGFSGNGAGLTGKENTLSNSAGLAAALSDETGTNTVVFNSSPTLSGNINFPGSGIWNSSGFVGIGTSTPSDDLWVSSNNTANIVIAGDANNSGNDGGYTGLSVWDQNSEIWYVGRDGTTPSDNLIFRRSGTTNDMVINTSGYVGIGTPTPSVQLHTTGGVRFATLGSGAVQSDANGNLSVSSDERLKIIQGLFTSSLEAILGIEPILYKYNELSGLDQDTVYAGFSAQNVMQYIPEAVGIDSRGYYSFNDRPIIAALVNSVKELKREIEELQKMNNIILKSYNAPAHNYKTRTIKTKTIKY